MNTEELYLDLLAKSLTNYEPEPFYEFEPYNDFENKELTTSINLIKNEGLAVCSVSKYNPLDRELGKDWPKKGETMVGIKRLQNLQYCVNEIAKNQIEGDFLEAGVWRGGASIFLNALNQVFCDAQKTIWVADSFEGLPKSSLDQDKKYDFTIYDELSVPLEQVKKNFEKYNLLTPNVKFIKGWFKDTLPNLNVKKLSLLRMDGDLYESTMDILNNLYHKVSIGGYIIVDDYCLDCCVQAITDFRKRHNITDEIKTIDWTGVYWQKSKQ